MSRLLPFRPDPKTSREPRLVDIDDEETADKVFAALSSDTARHILSELYKGPATASDLAEAVDTSLQNARYHLEKLQSAGLIEAVDTWYSSRGTEMTVYAPASDPLVVTAGAEEHTTVLRDAMKRLVGAVGLLGLASLAVNRLVRRFGGVPSDTQPRVATGDGQFSAATASPTPTEQAGTEDMAGGEITTQVTKAATPTPEHTPTETPVETLSLQNASEPITPIGTEGGIVQIIIGGVPPGLVFFTGGLLVLLLVSTWWYWTNYRYRLT